MIAEATKENFFDLDFLETYSSADCSDKKLPTPMEKASTKIKTIPVNKICFCAMPPTATPESNPTVETKLSSTPKIKFLT